MGMFLNNMDTEEMLSKISGAQKDELYRALWKEHVVEDVRGRLDEMDIDGVSDLDEEDYELFIDSVANKYVYDGDYDCNISYWDNIDNLIDEESKSWINESVEEK